MAKSRFPILIKEEGGDDFFKETISLKNQFLSDTPKYGHVSQDDWERFTELLNSTKTEDMRVHGSYYGLCVDGFAIQLFAYLNLKVNWFTNFKTHTKKNEKLFKMVEKHRLKKDFLSSGIKYGTVLYPNISLQPKFAYVDKLPIPGVPTQFSDDQTIIYGKP